MESFEQIEFTDEQKIEITRNKIRNDRNVKLLKSDWTQLSDVDLTPEKRNAWASYRQKLRDLPAALAIDPNDTYVSAYNSLVWPTPP